jgi:RHS repeat-associated protein
MDGDLIAAGGTKSVTVTDSQGNTYRDVDALNGTVIETQTYSAASGTVVADVIDTPYVSAPVASHSRPSPLPAQISVQTDTAKTVARDLLPGGGWRTHEIDFGYDPAHGNRRISADDKGDGSASAPETCSLTKYASSTINPQLMTYPYEILTVAGGCATTPGTTTTIGDVITLYDGNTTAGALDNSAYAGGVPVADATGQQVVSSYSGSTPTYLTTVTSTFDAYGRPLTGNDPNADPLHPTAGGTTTTYTPATGALPTQVVVTDAKGFPTTTVDDPTRSLPTEIRDANGRVTDMTYDPLGRLTQVWLPGRAMSANPSSPNEQFSYSISGGSAPSYTLIQTLLENGTYTSSYTLMDGLGQVRQTQSNPANGGAGRLITDTYYDSHGWTVKSHSQYYNADTGPSSTLQVTDDNVVPRSDTNTYDGRGRTTATTTFQFAVPQSTTTTAYPGAGRVDVIPPAPVAPTSTFTDVRGNMTAMWRYTGGTVTGLASDADVMSYSYDAAGRQTKIVDPNGDTWTYQYDLRGRQTLAHDPDAGDTITTYDNDGRVTSTEDANSTYNTYTYDVLGRKLTQYTGSATPGTGTEVASWTYDTGIAGAKGQLVSSTAYHNGFAYTDAFTGFAPTMSSGAYTPTGSKVTIPAGDGNDGVNGTYTSSAAFTPNVGLPYTMTMPAAGGLPSETVTSAYNEDDQLVSVGTSTTGITNVDYDPFGRVSRTTLGVLPNQAAVTYNYDAGSGSLLTQTFSEQALSTALDTINTYYNTVGQITASADLRNTGVTDLQCYTYDYAGRLKTAWTDTGTVTSAGQQYFPNTGACTHSEPTAGSAAGQIGGPAPYWQSYTYKNNGDRNTDTNHDVTGTTANDVSHTYHYPTASNLLQSMTTTGPSGTTTDSYGYYANGDTNTRTRASGNQSFGYDPAGRVASATTTSGNSSYVYDADGNLLVQHDPTETVLYLDGQEIHYNTSTFSSSGIRYIAGPAGAEAIENSSGAVTFSLADAHNTATLTVDAATQAVTRRSFDPYGNLRGASRPSYANGTWPNELAFLNKPSDANTSLSLIGPRQYDPTQGRFLQPDPVMETADVDQIGGYTYSADDPVNTSDPTGLDPSQSPAFCNGNGGVWVDHQCDWSGLGVTDDQADDEATKGCHSGQCMLTRLNLVNNNAAYREEQKEKVALGRVVAAQYHLQAVQLATQQCSAQHGTYSEAKGCVVPPPPHKSWWQKVTKAVGNVMAAVSTYSGYLSFIPGPIGEAAQALSVATGALSSISYLAGGYWNQAAQEATSTLITLATGGMGKLDHFADSAQGLGKISSMANGVANKYEAVSDRFADSSFLLKMPSLQKTAFSRVTMGYGLKVTTYRSVGLAQGQLPHIVGAAYTSFFSAIGGALPYSNIPVPHTGSPSTD